MRTGGRKYCARERSSVDGYWGRRKGMETAGTRTSHLAAGPHDLPQVAAALEQAGPFTTVVLTTEPGTDNAGRHSEMRWKDLHRSLSSAGAPAPDLDALKRWCPTPIFGGQRWRSSRHTAQ